MRHIWTFLTGSFLGWWILFLVVGSIVGLCVHFVRQWRRTRRFMMAQQARLENPDDAEVRFLLAQIHAEKKAWKKVEALIDEAIKAAAASKLYNHVPHKFLRLRAECLHAKGEFAGAAAAFRTALDVPSDTGYDRALIGVARSEWGAGKPEAALEFAKHAISENTSLLEGYFRWAQAADALGRGDELAKARSEFDRVAGVLPSFSKERRLRWRMAFFFFPIAKRIA